MDKNKSIANKTSEVMSQCININNAYKVKHEELKEVFREYKKLKRNNDIPCEDVEKNLEYLIKDIEKKVISKETFQRLLDEQSTIMKEFNFINSEVSKMYPDL